MNVNKLFSESALDPDTEIMFYLLRDLYAGMGKGALLRAIIRVRTEREGASLSDAIRILYDKEQNRVQRDCR